MSDARFVFTHCAGPLPKPAGTSPFRIKGEFYRHLSELVHHADSRGNRLTELFEAEGLTSFARQPFLASHFYDCLPFPRIVMAAARVLDKDVRELTQRMGEASWERQRHGVYGGVLTSMSVHNLARRFPAATSHMYDFGPVEARESPGHVQLIREGVPACVGEWWCRIATPFLAGPLRANGAQGLDISWRMTPSDVSDGVPLITSTFDVRWDP
ncbi:MAG: hypothetical protein U0234_31855 [Sandaracinus sp.]